MSAAHFKTDPDLERLPSGKCEGNDFILPLGQLAYNGLRWIGPLGPVRHPAERRRLKTVLQEIMYRAAHFICKARRRFLDFGRNSPVVAGFATVQDELLAAGQSP